MDDSQLLEDFVARNSESAFQSLVTRYLNLVRATALRQVREASLAEEVAQAVFILLARKAAKLRRTRNLVLSGWLYRTTRFVAARAMRGEIRRQRREQEAYQMQQISAADDTWRRIAPVLDDGMEQLDETDRNAVILRFFQDEPLRAVGGALGISEEAARKRVSRSLEKLRNFFASRGFTLSTAVLATALAGHRAEAAPAGLVGKIGAKAFAQAAVPGANLPVLAAETLAAWRWAVVKMVTAAGVGTAAVLFAAATALAPSGASPAVNPEAKPTPSAAPAVAPRVNAVKMEDKPGWHLSFQAVDAETGQGIAHARVLVGSVGDMKQVTASPQQIDQQSLQADAEGKCEIGLAYVNPLMVVVGVVAEGYTEWSAVGGTPKPLTSPYVLKVPRGARIGGVVKDEAGQPVAGAGIQVSFYGSGDSSEREFQQARPGLLDDDYVVATTDAAGRWTFGSCTTNGEFSIAVKHADFPAARFQNDDDPRFGPTTPPLKLADLRAGEAVMVLKSGLTLRGMVMDENGYHIAGAKVSPERAFPEAHTISTDAEGGFFLRAMAAGENVVTVMAEGFAPQQVPVQMSDDTAPLAVNLKRGAVLRLRVVDPAGAAVAGARVALEGWQGPNTLGWGGLTDADGRLTWDSAPIEPIRFSVGKEGYFYSRQNNFAADGKEHIIKLHPQVTLSGRVTDAETRQPVASFKALPGDDRSETAYGTNGQFELTFTEISIPLKVRIEADGYETLVAEPQERNAGNAIHLTHEFRLKKQDGGEAIHGVVVLPDGSAAAGAQVALAGEHPVELSKGRFIGVESSMTTQTDANGNFAFKAGLAAHAVLAVRQDGFANMAVTPDQHEMSIPLLPWGRIQGVLKLRTMPNAGQSVVLSGTPGPGQEDTLRLNLGAFMTQTDGQGNFTYEQAPAGDYNLFLAQMGVPYSQQTPVEVMPGATATAQIGGTGVVLSGKLVSAKAGPGFDWSTRMIRALLRTKLPYPSGLSARGRGEWYAKFSKTDEGQSSIRAMRTFPMLVQPDGRFTVEGVPPGDYEMSGQLSDTVVNMARGVMGHTIGWINQNVTVPQTDAGRADARIDLGEVVVGKP